MTLLALVLLVAACAVWPRRGTVGRTSWIGRAPRRPDQVLHRERPGATGVRLSGDATVEQAAAALGLVSVALRGGAGAVEAIEAVARVDDTPAGRELAVVAAAHRWGEPPDRAWERVGAGWAPAAAAWHAAHSAGAAPAGLLAAAARRMRDEEGRRTEQAVQRAGVLLVLPLGLCFLPGFVATTVVPIVVVLLGGLSP